MPGRLVLPGLFLKGTGLDIIRVEGGHPIEGRVCVSGAKNSALKLMAATLLAPGKTTLTNVPNISDVHVMGKVLKGMGATIEVVDEHSLAIDTSAVDQWEAPYELVAKMRASTAVLGPLLGRMGKAKIAMPGGCNLGARKIDMHILGLEALGVKFDTEHGYIYADAGEGESTTDLVFSGHNLIAENGSLLNESQLFSSGRTVSEIDVGRMRAERRRLTNFFEEMPKLIVSHFS